MDTRTFCNHCNRYVHGKRLCSDTDFKWCVIKEWLSNNVMYISKMLKRTKE